MIKNEQQLKITKVQLKKLEDSLVICNKQKNNMDKDMFNIMIAGINSQIDSLKKEIREYEELKSQKKPIIIYDLEEFPEALIRARINKRLTQEQLAKQVGLKPQQIQRYEQNNYQGISIQRAIKIGNVLGIKLGENNVLDDQPQMIYKKNVKE
jgi:ribosome-binding protein aMBF1 (putative translation factor)